MPFLRPISDRYFEDYLEGDVHHFGTIAVEAEEIIAFANKLYPQTFHTNLDAAKSGPFGGLIASGWLTTGLMTRSSATPYRAIGPESNSRVKSWHQIKSIYSAPKRRREHAFTHSRC